MLLRKIKTHMERMFFCRYTMFFSYHICYFAVPTCSMVLEYGLTITPKITQLGWYIYNYIYMYD